VDDESSMSWLEAYLRTRFDSQLTPMLRSR
jgi:hypothetical protein